MQFYNIQFKIMLEMSNEYNVIDIKIKLHGFIEV